LSFRTVAFLNDNPEVSSSTFSFVSLGSDLVGQVNRLELLTKMFLDSLARFNQVSHLQPPASQALQSEFGSGQRRKEELELVCDDLTVDVVGLKLIPGQRTARPAYRLVRVSTTS
jgi:hypothetical protein